ncbi:Uncharacterized protein dnm_042620 [Desulfonema magnum]|uniref:Uncharacterized protein n=1 Tax=Desulfonema magnum TaxID=45655 RepID=A0A975BMK8_9BACT|nr:Uncharacterized protein dnm_042620 [Desulfonema magnum]
MGRNNCDDHVRTGQGQVTHNPSWGEITQRRRRNDNRF